MANPTNCFICKNTWLGVGPICNNCKPATQRPPPPPKVCVHCGGAHVVLDCPLIYQQFQNMAGGLSNMARKRRGYNPFTGPHTSRPTTQQHYTNYAPLKTCPKCKGNYLIESKAGSVCSSCREVVHHPCRNCTSPNTRGLSCPDDNHVPGLASVQMIECQDCTFME